MGKGWDIHCHTQSWDEEIKAAIGVQNSLLIRKSWINHPKTQKKYKEEKEISMGAKIIGQNASFWLITVSLFDS